MTEQNNAGNNETSETRSIEDAIKYLRETTQKRKFMQTFDLTINLKNIDMKKETINREIILPHGRGRAVAVCTFSDSIPDSITTANINEMAKNPKLSRKLVRDYEFFMASPPMMLLVGKVLGRYLAPAGKMPKLLPPNADHNLFLSRTKNSVKLRAVKQMKIQCPVGNEKMTDAQIAENARFVISDLEKALSKGRDQIKNLLLKLTMGKPTKVVLR
ncbi:MAG: hypothetical protein ABIG30_01325 [Candidatus Aenigmatarchaeota archaeon]